MRAACRRPELIDRVRFYEDDTLLDVAYAEPFMLYSEATWIQEPYFPSRGAAAFHLAQFHIVKIMHILQILKILP